MIVSILLCRFYLYSTLRCEANFGLNFFNFINKHRVEEAKLLLLSKKMDQYSILGIAYESGFNSKTAFNTTFKKFTNQTPSVYKNSSPTL